MTFLAARMNKCWVNTELCHLMAGTAPWVQAVTWCRSIVPSPLSPWHLECPGALGGAHTEPQQF